MKDIWASNLHFQPSVCTAQEISNRKLLPLSHHFLFRVKIGSNLSCSFNSSKRMPKHPLVLALLDTQLWQPQSSSWPLLLGFPAATETHSPLPFGGSMCWSQNLPGWGNFQRAQPYGFPTDPTDPEEAAPSRLSPCTHPEDKLQRTQRDSNRPRCALIL